MSKDNESYKETDLAAAAAAGRGGRCWLEGRDVEGNGNKRRRAIHNEGINRRSKNKIDRWKENNTDRWKENMEMKERKQMKGGAETQILLRCL